MARDTTSGKEYEGIVELCIERSCRLNGLSKRPQAIVGLKPGGGRHIVDWELWSTNDENRRGLLSCKVQHTSGTAEEKIPYEILKLLETMNADHRYKISWVVLGGMGWNPGLLKFYRDDLPRYIPEMVGRVQILRTDDLISAVLKLPE